MLTLWCVINAITLHVDHYGEMFKFVVSTTVYNKHMDRYGKMLNLEMSICS